MTKQYDVLVIGSGTAGLTAAYELNRNELKVGVVEHSQRPGGTCALRGCQAKKWFYEGAETVARSRHLSGIGVTSPTLASWLELRDAKNRFTKRVPEKTVNGLEKAGIEFIRGRARFTDGGSFVVDQQQLSAHFIVLATGAVPMRLPMDGAENLVTNAELMELDRLPRRIIFIGGGFISFEFAHFAVRLGPKDIQCTLLEAGPRPLGPFDEEMVGLLTKASESEGVDIVCDVDISTIEKTGGSFTVTAKDGRRFESDLVVHGAGRSPDIEDLNLKTVDIENTGRGISVDRKMVTTNPHVYAIGDCAATIQLARVADAEAKVAADGIASHLKGKQSETKMDYTAVPSILFTYPQYGMVGTTEAALKEANASYRKSFDKDLDWPTYKRVGMKSAAYKLLAGEDGQLLGAHVLSDNATGLINTFTLAMVNHISIDKLYRQSTLTPYPSRESDILYMLEPFIS